MNKEWEHLEEIGFRVRFKDDYIEVTRKHSWLEWIVLIILLIFISLVVVNFILGEIEYAVILGTLALWISYLQLRIFLFKLKFTSSIYEITELNYEYSVRQVSLISIKDFIIRTGPFLAEINVYTVNQNNEMFKLLSTNSKYTNARETLEKLCFKLKENLDN